MTQLSKVLAESGETIEPKDQAMIEAGIKSLAVALFAAQMNGMIRFPSDSGIGWTIGEIESGLDLVAAAFMQKLIESKPS